MSSFLIIDAENLKISEEELLILLSYFPKIEKILIYCDMEKNNILQHYQDWCLKYPCFMIHVPTLGGKNSVDLQISLDMMEYCLAKKKEILHFIMASHDRDFFPLFAKLKFYGKSVSLVVHKEPAFYPLDLVQECLVLKDIPLLVKNVMKCFLLERDRTLSISKIKKNLKKLNLKKNVRVHDFQNLSISLQELACPIPAPHIFNLDQPGQISLIFPLADAQVLRANGFFEPI